MDTLHRSSQVELRERTEQYNKLWLGCQRQPRAGYNDIEEMRNKMVKLEEKEDWISNLPDHIIHHILSFLPSTKQAIRTSVLSKRWRNQWTGVPVLIFDSDGMSYETFVAFVDNTLILYDCSKIKKIHLKYNIPDAKDPEYFSKFLIATRTNNQKYTFPEFVFNNASLIKLTTINCNFMPRGIVNWRCLTSLNISYGKSNDQAIEYILSGSPLLKSLKLSYCSRLKKLVIPSKYLEILDLRYLRRMFYLEISCPKLKILKLISTSNVKTIKLLNLPSSLYVTISFYDHDWEKLTDESTKEIHRSLVKDILQQLHHIKKLRIFWNCFFEIISTIDMRDWISPMLNVKCLTLHCSWSSNKHCGGLAWLLRNSPRLKKFVIYPDYHQDNDDCGENYWNSNTVVYDCLSSHLKTVKFICSRRKDGNYKFMLNFLQFLFMNARVLKSMVVEMKDYGTKNVETAFPLEVSQELLSLPRCSQRATIELICS